MKDKVVKSKIEVMRGDLIIRGHMWKKKSIEKASAVILSHGFMADERMCHTYAKFLADLGYVCFTYDFNGGGIRTKSSGKSEFMSVLTEKEDLKQMISYVKDLSCVNASHISLLGCSQGGFVSAMVAKDLGKEIEKLIMFYPALCIPDDARKGNFIMIKFDPANIPEILAKFPMKLGKAYAEAVMNMDAFEEIKGYEGPVFLIHGTADRIVNIEYSRKARSLYENMDYHEIEGADHGFKKENDELAMKYLGEFMAK